MKGSIASRWTRLAAALAASASLAAGALLAWAAPAGPPPAAAVADPTPAQAKAAAAAYDRAAANFQNARYAEASADVERALALDPHNRDAALLKQIIDQHLGQNAAAPGAAANPRQPAPKVTLLTKAQVYAIRLAELHDSDTHLVGHIDRKVLELFWNDVIRRQPGADASRAAEDQFLNTQNFDQQVALIRASGLPQYIDKIKLLSDPQDMIEFRSRVQPYVLRICATAACHAGPNAGHLRLLRPGGAATPEQLYTNFYILATYVKGGDRMIDRDNPADSLLLQYGLPRAVATKPHPGKIEVRRLASEDSPEFHTLAAWIRSLTFPAPDYHLPGTTAATQPR